MNEIWRNWEGQVVEHKYQLRSLIGSTDHSVVFLAECRTPETQTAAVKFLPADIPNAELVLDAWHKAAQLSHPTLLRIFGTGQCKIDDRELLYVAMEYAEENLAEIIPQRALTAEEAREAMNAVVEVLVYLHGKDLTHGHICPANILAIGDQLKISSDTIEPMAEKREMTRERSAYDAPEIPRAPYTPSADVWSLGVTLVAMLTQQPAVLPFNENADPVVLATIREPFAEIARNALRRKAELRWTSSQIAERLNPNLVAAKAAVAGAPTSAKTPAPQAASAAQVAALPTPTPAPASGPSPMVAPLSVPLSKEPAVPLAKQPRTPVPPSRVTAAAPRQRETVVLPNYAVPLFVGALVLAAIIALPIILRNRAGSVSKPVTASAPVKSAPVAETAKPPATRKEATAPPNAPPKEELRSSAPPPASVPSAPAAAPAVLRSAESPPAAETKNSSDAQGRGDVLDQALPQVSAKALSTISGTVRVVVKAHVDITGQVSGAELQESGPSRYFADKAMQAAQRWVFNSPEVDGRSVESDWLIRFEYTHDGVKAFPEQVTP